MFAKIKWEFVYSQTDPGYHSDPWNSAKTLWSQMSSPDHFRSANHFCMIFLDLLKDPKTGWLRFGWTLEECMEFHGQTEEPHEDILDSFHRVAFSQNSKLNLSLFMEFLRNWKASGVICTVFNVFLYIYTLNANLRRCAPSARLDLKNVALIFWRLRCQFALRVHPSC